MKAPQDLHPLLSPGHRRPSPPCQPPTTRPQSIDPLVRLTALPLCPPCQVPRYHQAWAPRLVPGKAIAAVIHAILTMTASARTYVRMVFARLALLGRFVEVSVKLMVCQALHPLALESDLAIRFTWRRDHSFSPVESCMPQVMLSCRPML